MSSRAGARLDQRRALRPPARGDVLVAVSLGPAGDAVGLWASPADAAALVARVPAAPTEVSFPRVTVDPPVRVRVSRQSARGRVRSVTTIDGFTLAVPRVAAFANGDLLLVGCRCRWSEGEIVPNAVLCSPSGRVLRRGVVGDGVHSLDTTDAGEVWVGYSDEGVFGNFGWGDPGPPPLGARGLLRLDHDLDVVWRYPEEPAHPIDAGPDLNLVDGTVWMTHDSSYPVARIVGGTVTTWDNPTGSAAAVLVDGDVVALVGREATTGTLEGGSFRPATTCRLERPARPLRWVARGATLHVFEADGAWGTVDVAALLAAGTPVGPAQERTG